MFRVLGEECQTDEALRNLSKQAQGATHLYAPPCKNQPDNRGHHYQIHFRAPIRVLCSERDCGWKLQRTALLHWIAELLQGGLIDRTTFQMRWSRLGAQFTVSLLFAFNFFCTTPRLILNSSLNSMWLCSPVYLPYAAHCSARRYDFSTSSSLPSQL